MIIQHVLTILEALTEEVAYARELQHEGKRKCRVLAKLLYPK